MCKWNVNPFAEQTMKKMGLSWTVEDVSLANIDFGESTNNPARFGAPVDEERVKDYANNMKNGDVFPMPVFFGPCKNPSIAGGRHTTEAYKLTGLGKIIKAYIINTDDGAIRETICGALNPDARTVPKNERILLALRAIHNGISSKVAASLYGLTDEAITIALRHAKVRKTLDGLGVATAGLNNGHINALSPLLNMENVLKGAANLLIDGKISASEANGIISDIRQKKTEAQQLAVVAAKMSRFDVSAPRYAAPRVIKATTKKGRPKASIIRTKMSEFSRYCNGVKTISEWGVTEPADKKNFIEEAEQFLSIFTAIIKRSRAGSK